MIHHRIQCRQKKKASPDKEMTDRCMVLIFPRSPPSITEVHNFSSVETTQPFKIPTKRPSRILARRAPAERSEEGWKERQNIFIQNQRARYSPEPFILKWKTGGEKKGRWRKPKVDSVYAHPKTEMCKKEQPYPLAQKKIIKTLPDLFHLS